MSHREDINVAYLNKDINIADSKTKKAVEAILKHAIINDDDAIHLEKEGNLIKNIKLIKDWISGNQGKEGNDVLLDFEVKLDATGKSRFFKIKHGTGDNFFNIYLYDENKKGKSLLSITKEGKVICDDIQLLKSITVGDDKSTGKITTHELVVDNIYGKTVDGKRGNEAVEIDEKGNVTFHENVIFEGVVSSEAGKFLADGNWKVIRKNVQQFDLYEFYCSSMNTESKRNYLSEFLISIGQRPDEEPTKSNNSISEKHHFYNSMGGSFLTRWLMPAKKWNRVELEIQRHGDGIAIFAKADPRVHDTRNPYVHYSIKKLWDRELFDEIAPDESRKKRRIQINSNDNVKEVKEPNSRIVIKGVNKKNQVN